MVIVERPDDRPAQVRSKRPKRGVSRSEAPVEVVGPDEQVERAAAHLGGRMLRGHGLEESADTLPLVGRPTQLVEYPEMDERQRAGRVPERRHEEVEDIEPTQLKLRELDCEVERARVSGRGCQGIIDGRPQASVTLGGIERLCRPRERHLGDAC